MKQFLLSFLFCLGITTMFAQYPGNANDWIDYSAVHYKFKISEKGIYRISTAELAAAGMDSNKMIGADFQLYHNGEVVPLFVTTKDQFGTNDYIEFLGKPNDGHSDTPLYKEANWQPSTHKSLFEDAGTYFLTTTGNTSSIENGVNDLSNLPAKEEYFMHTNSINYDDKQQGASYVISSTVIHGSEFSEFEGYSLKGPGGGLNIDLKTDKVYKTAPEKAILSMTFAPLAYKANYSVDVEYYSLINGKYVYGQTKKAYSRVDFDAEYEPTDLKEGKTRLRFKEDMSGRFLYSDVSITYPRTFNFSGKNYFELDAKDGTKYFEFSNIPKSDDEVVFYDLSTLKRYKLPHASNIKLRTKESENLLVYDNEVSQVTNIENVGVFENFIESKDVLLIYSKDLDVEIDGENIIDKYIAHRTSEIGGSRTVKKVEIGDLLNQYAYGINMHASVIKNYVLELKEQNALPKYIVIFGKAIEYYRVTNANKHMNFVPTFGQPGSDNLLTSDYYTIYNVHTSIGRVSARTPIELNNYINKVINYETNIKDLSDDVQTKEKVWMKKSVHLGGGKDAWEQNVLRNYLNGYKTIYENPLLGGDVTSFFKQNTDPVGTESVLLDEVINDGVSMLTFFGHASPTVLEFDIRSPEEYTNDGKPLFMLNNGCFIGNIYTDENTMSEDYISIADKGAVGFLGPSLYGIGGAMNNFSTVFYNEMANKNYEGGTAGDYILQAINEYKSNSNVAIITKQQMIYNGDPSLIMHYMPKPDYLITSEDVRFEPDLITADSDDFDVVVNVTNIGKALNEDVVVRLTRTLPNGEKEQYDQTISNLYFKGEVIFTIQTNPVFAEGVNNFNVEIDPDNLLDEVTRANNQLVTPIQRQVLSSNVTPILPYEFAITNDKNVVLKASTSVTEPINRNFIIEIDTTEMFNSPLLKRTSISSYGGTLTWQPNINYQNEQEYYWRVRLNEDNQMWDSSSFIFLDNYEQGWNQSHYYQFDENKTDFLLQKSKDKVFEFGINYRNLNVKAGVYPNANLNELGYSIDGYRSASYRLIGDIAVAVFDRNTGNPWENEVVESISLFENRGKYNSWIRDANFAEPVFWYKLDTPENRKDFMDMLTNVISEDEYVLIYSQEALEANKNNWQGDEAIYGYTIFDVLKDRGATLVDGIGDKTPYVFYYQNNNLEFEHKFEEVAPNEVSKIDQNLIMPAKFNEGSMSTDEIGPVTSWKTFKWNWTSSYDNDPEGDQASYTIYGITDAGEENALYENQTEATLDISSIDAKQYPYLRLQYNAQDGINQTPPQLDYWRIVYDRAGELAINVNETVEMLPIDVERGQDTTLSYSIDNIGSVDYDKVLVRYTFTDANGTVKTVDKIYDQIPAGESINVSIDLFVEGFENVGVNSVLVDVNPDNDQLEQYHFNNIAYFNYSVEKDSTNPYLDVTFDGIHIIDGDLVSDTPNILISLTDDNKYFALDNPEDFELVVIDPLGIETIYTVNNPEVTFYPGSTGNNTAKIEFSPEFLPGVHTLQVRARDRSNNLAAENNYIVEFEVTDEDIITQVVNYPNPFTTKTSFIANIIGEIPDQILIQIFAPNGQVVQELQAIPSQITVAEGNNYYKLAEWDGNDTFGDPVGNGTYFYKVTLKRNGQTIEPKNDEAYSKYFKNGIGKLYILR